MKYLLGIIGLLALGCKQSAKQVNNKSTDSVVSVKTDTALNTEYLDWYKVKLKGSIPMLSSFKATSQFLGKPDSIVTPDYKDISVSYFNGEKFKYVYYKGLQFEMVKDSLAFTQIDFSKDTALYFTSDKIKLSHSTTLEAFKKVFPKAVAKEFSGTALDKYKVIGLDVAKSPTEDRWMFWFSRDEGRLLKIEYFIPY
jgi:hypothetical protein